MKWGIAGLGVAAGVIWYIFMPKAPNILRGQVSGGPKRYIVYNQKQFTKSHGQMRASTTTLLSSLGAKDVKPMELINGATFEADEKVQSKIKSFSSEWVIQEEIEHQILQFKCSRCEDIACPSPNPNPTPQPTPNPTPNPSPSPIEADRSWGRTRVHAKEAMALVDTSKVKVCVVDTGIDMSHPNKGNVLSSQDYTGKGSAQDGNGHGTHTAGTIAGTSGVGISRAGLFVCKGLNDQGSGSSSALAQCLMWCGAQGAQIVSNSWGSTQSDSLINQAITALTQRGIYVFVANGNDSGPVNWPAKLSASNSLVYAIAASDSADRITSFSSRGPETRFISPGSNITSNWPGGGLRALDGTSMATPHAAGICAFGIAKGLKPCVKASGTVGGYNFADALETAR